MDRKIAPELKSVDAIDFLAPQIIPVNECVNLFAMTHVANETSRVDLYFDGGTIRGSKGTSSFVNGLLLSGNEKISSTDISHQIDLFGGFFESGITTEGAVISIYALRKNMPALLAFVQKSIAEMSCLEKEIQEMVSDKKQKFQVNLQKTRFLAQREFQKRIFASDEKYSKIVTPDYYENVDRKELQDFFHKNYLKGLTKISVVGNFDKNQIQSFIELFRPWAINKQPEHILGMQNEAGEFHVDKESAVQTAIRVGRILFNKKHEDYVDFNVLNTILGDYFGSRLMTNIREDKGYTYGIGSMVAEYNDFGYFMIGTEVGKAVKKETLVEIKNEFERLQNELVSETELELVKNYLLGQLLKSADGAYSMMDLYLSAEVHGKDLEFYNQSITSIRDITPKRLQELAKKYLNWEDMSIVSAG
jgi:predicted Zn-dependent peptidase